MGTAHEDVHLKTLDRTEWNEWTVLCTSHWKTRI